MNRVSPKFEGSAITAARNKFGAWGVVVRMPG
jgi:hypothetical protein